MKVLNLNYRRRQKIVLSLSREQVDFLDKIGKDVFFSGGEKISRGNIISVLVDIFLEYKQKINKNNTNNKNGLKKEIIRGFKEKSCPIGFCEERKNEK